MPIQETVISGRPPLKTYGTTVDNDASHPVNVNIVSTVAGSGDGAILDGVTSTIKATVKSAVPSTMDGTEKPLVTATIMYGIDSNSGVYTRQVVNDDITLTIPIASNPLLVAAVPYLYDGSTVTRVANAANAANTTGTTMYGVGLMAFESGSAKYQAALAFDANSGAGTEYVLGAILRISGSSGSIEAKGQQTMANSIPVAIASDQSALKAIGNTAHGSSVADAPLLIGAEGRSTLGTAVSTGQQTRIVTNRYGLPYVTAIAPSRASSNGTPITATTTSVVSAPSSGNHLRVTRIHISNGGATATWAGVRDGASGTIYYYTYLVQGAVYSLDLNTSGVLDLTTATRLDIVLSAAGSCEYTIDYLTVAD